MVDKPLVADSKPIAESATPSAPTTPRRPPGHRSTDVRDTVAEMAARAQEISQEAGSKVATAMKDVIAAAAGLAGFAIESARDLVQYMVRRGQMTQEEADRIIREAEEASRSRKVPRPDGPRPAQAPKAAAPKKSAPKKPAARPAAKQTKKSAPARSKPTKSAASRKKK